MLFQDFAARFIDFKPYCKVLLCVRRMSPYVPAWYHVDELAKAHKKLLKTRRGKHMNRFIGLLPMDRRIKSVVGLPVDHIANTAPFSFLKILSICLDLFAIE